MYWEKEKISILFIQLQYTMNKDVMNNKNNS